MTPVLDRQQVREQLQDELATVRAINASLRLGGLCAEEMADLAIARSEALLQVRHLLHLLYLPAAPNPWPRKDTPQP